MECLQKNGSASAPCRALSKEYLECRMQKYVILVFSGFKGGDLDHRGLMERDEWKNLGMANVGDCACERSDGDSSP